MSALASTASAQLAAFPREHAQECITVKEQLGLGGFARVYKVQINAASMQLDGTAAWPAQLAMKVLRRQYCKPEDPHQVRAAHPGEATGCPG